MFKKVHVFRVKPGQELAGEIARYCRDNAISSGIILGIIGSAESARLNFIKELPGKYVGKDYAGPMEIVCAQGSVALKGSELIIHIHIQLSREDACWGGHLVEARIFSTAEVVIGELDEQLRRYADKYTGLNELEAAR
ncbi:MAG: DNA-binding protein [Chloroflexi bacterium]|nr:DNA-binding protein [Chloroflexota bacterium]